MVVVIDDRSDVWGDIPNLVKVVPCEPRCDDIFITHSTADDLITGHSESATSTRPSYLQSHPLLQA
jgi:hypothetical protein